jgi:predicted RNA-binding protein with PIN domain
MTADQGPSGPVERQSQGPSGPVERQGQGPSGPVERQSQGSSGPVERQNQGSSGPAERQDQGPSGPVERQGQGPSGPVERQSQGPSGPVERQDQGPSGPAERQDRDKAEPASAEAGGAEGRRRAPPDLRGAEADELLRPAAELAIEMARTGARLQPPLDVPSRLRPLLGHAKVTRPALATARRVVEEDAGFRSQVARAVAMPDAEATLGRAGILWLSRPEGWEAELAALVEEARAAAAARAEDAEERTALRRLRHAEEARDRAERAAEEARRAADSARADVQEERRLRRAADDAAQRATRHASSLEEQLTAAHRRAETAARSLAERADAEAATTAALAAAEAEVHGLRSEVDDLRTALAWHASHAGLTTSAPPPAGPADADRRALGDAVAAASSAAAALSAALGRAAAALEPEAPASRHDATLEAGPGPPARGAKTQPRWVRRQPRGSRRRAAPLPPLVRDDSPEAAQHLVSLPGVALLVDGYNATLSTWPGLPLPEQRLRLIDALAELAARTGARPEVVFDGVDTLPDMAATKTLRSRVKVSFTRAEVEADDVLIARAHQLPLPVVVASDDRRVRDGARAAGANVLGIEQLLAALRRQGAPPAER